MAPRRARALRRARPRRAAPASAGPPSPTTPRRPREPLAARARARPSARRRGDRAGARAARGRRARRARSRRRVAARAPGDGALGRLAGGIVAYREGYAALAWDAAARASRASLWPRSRRPSTSAPACASRPTRRCAELRALVADDPPEVRSKSWYDIARGGLRLRATRSSPARSSRSSTATSREDAPAGGEAERDRDWMRPWIAADAGLADRAARRRAAAARSRSWTTAIPGANRPRPTSATTSRASPRSATSSATAACACTATRDLVDLLERLRERDAAGARAATTSTPTSR